MGETMVELLGIGVIQAVRPPSGEVEILVHTQRSPVTADLIMRVMRGGAFDLYIRPHTIAEKIDAAFKVPGPPSTIVLRGAGGVDTVEVHGARPAAVRERE